MKKTAIVTGSSRGIGFAIASAYASRCTKIVFNDLYPDKLEKGIAAYKEKGIELM